MAGQNNFIQSSSSEHPSESMRQTEPMVSFVNQTPAVYGLSMPYTAMGQSLPQVSSLMQPYFMQTTVSANKPEETNLNPVIDTNRASLLPAMALMPGMLSPVNFSQAPTFYTDNRQTETLTHTQGPACPWTAPALSYTQSNNTCMLNVTPQVSVSQINETTAPIPSVLYSQSHNTLPAEPNPVLQHPKRRLLEKIEAAVAFLEGNEREKLANEQINEVPHIQEHSVTTCAPPQNNNETNSDVETVAGQSDNLYLSKEMSESKNENTGKLQIEIVPDESLNNDQDEQYKEEDNNIDIHVIKAEESVGDEESDNDLEHVETFQEEEVVEKFTRKRGRKRNQKPTKTAVVPSKKKQTTHFRHFQNHWVKSHPWIFYDGENMYCQVCIRHKPESKSVFTSGTDKFRRESCKLHETTKDHKMAWKLHKEKRKCNCLTSKLDSEFDERQRYMLQNILQHFRWLDYNKRLGVLSCDLCKRHNDETFELKLDSKFQTKDIIIHRDSVEHLEAEETEINAWDTLFDTGMAEIDASLLQLLACRESIYTSITKTGKNSTSTGGRCQDEEGDDDWMPGASRRKSKRPCKYIQSQEEIKTNLVEKMPEKEILPNPTDVMGTLIKLIKRKDHDEGSKISESGENNNNTLNITHHFTKSQTFKIKGVNPLIVESEIQKNSITKEFTSSSSRRSQPLVKRTKGKIKIDIPCKKINIPKFKYRVMPTMGKFNPIWVKEFQWLEYHKDTNVMLCKCCVKHRKKNSFLRGCRMFQRRVLLSHQRLKMHQTAEEFERIRKSETASAVKTVKTLTVTGVQCLDGGTTTEDQPDKSDHNKQDSQTEKDVEGMAVTNQAPHSKDPNSSLSSNTVTIEVSNKPYNPDIVDSLAITQLLANTGLWTSTPGAQVNKTPVDKAQTEPGHGQSSSHTLDNLTEVHSMAQRFKSNDMQSTFVDVMKSNLSSKVSLTPEDQSNDLGSPGKILVKNTANKLEMSNVSSTRNVGLKKHQENIDSSQAEYNIETETSAETKLKVASSSGSKEKRKPRTFQSHWQKNHPWLVYDEEKKTMYCQVCIRYDLESTFTTGNSSFKLSTIKSHQGSILHQKAVQMEFLQEIAE